MGLQIEPLHRMQSPRPFPTDRMDGSISSPVEASYPLMFNLRNPLNGLAKMTIPLNPVCPGDL